MVNASGRSRSITRSAVSSTCSRVNRGRGPGREDLAWEGVDIRTPYTVPCSISVRPTETTVGGDRPMAATTVGVAQPEAELAPVTDDFSAYIIAGAVSADPAKFRRETEGRTPAQGIQDGVDAERLGFRRVFISERWDLKLADVILAGIGAKTTRLELATGIIVPTTRHPWAIAALGATMQASFGARFVLGLGRGDN